MKKICTILWLSVVALCVCGCATNIRKLNHSLRQDGFCQYKDYWNYRKYMNEMSMNRALDRMVVITYHSSCNKPGADTLIFILQNQKAVDSICPYRLYVSNKDGIGMMTYWNQVLGFNHIQDNVFGDIVNSIINDDADVLSPLLIYYLTCDGRYYNSAAGIQDCIVSMIIMEDYRIKMVKTIKPAGLKAD